MKCNHNIVLEKGSLCVPCHIWHQSWFLIHSIVITLHIIACYFNYRLFMRVNRWSVTKGHICKYIDRTSKGDLSFSLSLTSYSVCPTLVSIGVWVVCCLGNPSVLSSWLHCVCVSGEEERVWELWTDFITLLVFLYSKVHIEYGCAQTLKIILVCHL